MLEVHAARLEVERSSIGYAANNTLEERLEHFEQMKHYCSLGAQDEDSRSSFEMFSKLIEMVQVEQVKRATESMRQTDGMFMEASQRIVIESMLPLLTVKDIVAAIQGLKDEQIIELADELPDKLTDLILTLADPQDLYVPESFDLYKDDDANWDAHVAAKERAFWESYLDEHPE